MPLAPPTGPVAVLTGDIIDSSRLDAAQRRRLLTVLKSLTETLRDALGAEALPYPIDVYGGDGWQVLIHPASKSLRASLLIRACLMADVAPDASTPVDTRVVVARGGVDFLAEGRLSESEGEAFRLSGRRLQDLGDRRMAFVNAGRSHLDDWDVVFRLTDALASAWTARQARTISGALRGWRQDAIAELWTPRISQPSVARHLRAAHWDAIDTAVRGFERRVGALEDDA